MTERIDEGELAEAGEKQVEPTRQAVRRDHTQCPIPATHRRLGDCHRLWHEMLAAYSDPDAFRSSLNSAVQTFRSVTNMLQAEKRRVPEFDEWYEAWRSRMRDDEIMSWLNDARVTVFHKGDLETHSEARIRIRDEWAPAKELADERVSPFEATDALAARYAQEFARAFDSSIGGSPPEHLLLEVERRWVSDDLPTHELVDATAHGYGVLARIVGEAHQLSGVAYETADYTHGDPREVDVSHLGGRLPCMVTAPEQRTAIVKLHTGELVQRAIRTFAPPANIEQIATERYGLDESFLTPAGSGLFDRAEMYMNIARRALLVDGYAVPVTFLFGPNGMRQIVHPAEDRAEKFLNWDMIAAEVEAFGATELISIAEAWLYPLPRSRLEAEITMPTRAEQLSVLAATKGGSYRMWSMNFERSPSGRIVPKPIQVVDLAEAPNFISAAIERWKRWA